MGLRIQNGAFSHATVIYASLMVLSPIILISIRLFDYLKNSKKLIITVFGIMCMIPILYYVYILINL